MKQDPLLKRGEIHLGDLVRALAELKCKTLEQTNAIASCLGFVIEEAPVKPTPEIYDRNRYSLKTRSQPTKSEPPTRFSVPPEPEPPVHLPDNKVPGQLQALQPKTPPAVHDPEDWLDDNYEILVTERPPPAVMRTPLFSENTSRGIFSSALATQRIGDEIDVHRLIKVLVRGKSIRDIPRYPISTLNRGCQVLLDYRHSMVPFWEDLTSLIGQISEVLMPDTIEIFNFDGNPLKARRWTPNQQFEPWRPHKRPILVATDFGIQGRGKAAVADRVWREFIARCVDNGSPLLILIPWSRERWPTNLGGYPELIHWSPYTTAAMVKRTIGLGSTIKP